MANVNFKDVFVQLDNMGIGDTVLPFLLVFTVLFAILDRTKILGQDKKNINVVVALVISLMVVIPHVTDTYPTGQDPVEILNNALPNVSVVLIAIIMLLVLVGAFGAELGIGQGLIGVVALLAVGVILWIFGGAAGWFQGVPGFLEDSAVQSAVIVVLTLGLIIFLITGGGGGGIGKSVSKLSEIMKRI